MMMDFGLQSTANLTPFLNKLEKNQLALEDILEEDLIIDDIKNNNQSQFINFLTDEKIRKLIDYSTKLPKSSQHNIGYKYPFNATEILCSENTNFQKKFMSETPLEDKELKLKEQLRQAKKITKNGFISELFKIINKVKKEEEKSNNKDGNEISDDSENEDDYDNNIDISEDSEDENKEKKKVRVIYGNVDYLLNFLKESDETKDNYVLVGYFYKILNTLINLHSMKIVSYLYDYPKKNEFDILDLFIKHMNRKSMCNIINKLLIFEDELISKYEDKKINLLERIFDELNICNEKNKYECICDSLSLVMNNSLFFDLFISRAYLLEKIYKILFNSQKNTPKAISIMKLLIKINENTLQHFETHYTNTQQENNNNELEPFNIETTYSHEIDKSLSSREENSEFLKKFLFTMFDILEKNQFSFLEDIGNCDLKENNEFISTYMEKQKKIGMKKIVQIEYIFTIIDIFINSYASKYHENKIEKLINIANEKNIFFNLHNLFFLFPFSNIYQIFYKKIMEIILNENSPNCLTDSFFIETIGQKRNLIDLYIDKIISDMKFIFDLTKTKCFNPCFAYAISILNKIYNCQNINVKKIIEKNKNISVFNEIMVEEIKNIFSQKLLSNDTFNSYGGIEEEKPLQTFGSKNFLEIFDENCKIYELYKDGGNYQKLLNEKKEQKIKEKEKNLRKSEISAKKGKNNGLEYIDDLDEEEDDDPLFKVEKINLEKDKDNFLAILNKPTEELMKEKDFNKDNNNIKNIDEDFLYKPRFNINDLDDIEDQKENIEKEQLNEDLTPNQIENKIYHVEYNKNKELINKTEVKDDKI